MYNIRINNLEFRYSNCNKKYEIIKWNNPESCICLGLFYEQEYALPDFRSASERPFVLDDEEYACFTKLIRLVYNEFAEVFNKENQ